MKWILISSWLVLDPFQIENKQRCIVVKTPTSCMIARGMERVRLESYLISEVGECWPMRATEPTPKECLKGDVN